MRTLVLADLASDVHLPRDGPARGHRIPSGPSAEGRRSMIRKSISVVFGILILVVSAVCQEGKEPPVPLLRGRVLNPDGQPVADARVAQHWSFKDGSPNSKGALKTDATGTFEGRLTLHRLAGTCALAAYSPDNKMAGAAVLGETDDLEQITIQLQPAIRVHGKLTSPKLGKEIAWTNTYLYLMPGECRNWKSSSPPGHGPPEFDFLAPPGRYILLVLGQDVETLKREIVLRADEPDVDLGAVEMTTHFFTLNKGKKIDWTVTAARGVALEKSDIEDFRGKWLFVEFWGFW